MLWDMLAGVGRMVGMIQTRISDRSMQRMLGCTDSLAGDTYGCQRPLILARLGSRQSCCTEHCCHAAAKVLE